MEDCLRSYRAGTRFPQIRFAPVMLATVIRLNSVKKLSKIWLSKPLIKRDTVLWLYLN